MARPSRSLSLGRPAPVRARAGCLRYGGRQTPATSLCVTLFCNPAYAHRRRNSVPAANVPLPDSGRVARNPQTTQAERMRGIVTTRNLVQPVLAPA